MPNILKNRQNVLRKGVMDFEAIRNAARCVVNLITDVAISVRFCAFAH